MKDLELDRNGHLQDFSAWTESIGTKMAQADDFDLSKNHWKIIHLVRKIYLETETSPPMRLLIKLIKKEIGEDLGNSRVLYQLFPDGPVRLACKYGGLPKPKHCL